MAAESSRAMKEIPRDTPESSALILSQQDGGV